MSPKKMLSLAAEIARAKNDDRNFFIGAIGIRGDGTSVIAYNGAPKIPTPAHHAETRLARKLDRGAIVFVARTLYCGDWAMSKPCPDCERSLRKAYVKRVYYTIAPNEWGCLYFDK